MVDFDWPWQYKFPPFFTSDHRERQRLTKELLKETLEACMGGSLCLETQFYMQGVQPNIETFKKQLEAWCSLVLAYQRHLKQYSLDVTEAQNSELFYNKQLNRRLSLEAIYVVLDELKRRGNLEWKDKNKKSCTLIWRTPNEWGKMIYNWICSRAMNNTVCTLYELSDGEESEGQEFHGLDKEILVRALKSLEAEGKAEFIVFDGSEGVKFF